MIQGIIVRIAKVFDKNKIAYMLMGGQTLLLHGMIRTTEDIDITLGVDVDELAKIKKILKANDFVSPKNVDDKRNLDMSYMKKWLRRFSDIAGRDLAKELGQLYKKS